jgi:hypothetical protein
VLLAASTGATGPLQGQVGLNGSVVALGNATASSIGSVNYWADVTALVKPTLDAAPAGSSDLPVTESNSGSVDGVILAVVFDDPGQATDRSVTFLFGATKTTGDTFQLQLSQPFDPTSPTALLQMSLGISYSFQSGGAQQFSQVDVNGQRLTTSAGGEDDGEPGDGALITAGGVGDADTNPAPQAAPADPRSDDELYDLRGFVPAGATSVDVDTLNPSNDDNILFAAFTSDPPVTQVVTGPDDEQDVVSLGDSYSSGEGTFDYDNNVQAKACHRGPDAWPRIMQRRVAELATIAHKACTGATVADLTRSFKGNGPQLPSTPDPTVDLVTLTAGAADVAVKDFLLQCVNPAPTASCAGVPGSNAFQQRLSLLGRSLDALYPKIRRAYPDARIVDVGYPQLTPSTDRTPVGCGWLKPDEQAAAATLTQRLNTALQAADGRAGVDFVDASSVLQGHELCTGESWVVPLSASTATEPGHPTLAGQTAYAERVAEALGLTLVS